MENLVNASIQILPKNSEIGVYEAIDKAIAIIQDSGLKCLVCPFETVIEGKFSEVQTVMNRAMQAVLEVSDEIIVVNKWQISRKSDVTMEQKIGKYSGL